MKNHDTDAGRSEPVRFAISLSNEHRETPGAVYPFWSTLFRIAVFSLLVGAGLSFVNVSAEDILGSVGLSPLELWIYMIEFKDWAVPNMILGAFIVVPVWLVLYLIRPPRAG